MGILNLTPDSFSQDGLLVKDHRDISKIVNVAQNMIKDGADLIDVGGESTRPGASRISVKEEIERIIPCIRSLAKKIKSPIAVDSYKAEVVTHALDNGASIVNNIMGTKPKARLLKMVKNYDAAIILMHSRKTPKTMQKNIQYKNLIFEIIMELKRSIENCLEIGIGFDKIIVDPGIGFGKTTAHNLEILNRLKDFTVLNRPILIGTSRKSFIGQITKREVRQRLAGTIASVSCAVMNNAHIVRVHDVKETKDAASVIDAILNYNQWENN